MSAYGSRELKIGDSGPDVTELQVRLALFGTKGHGVKCNGSFDETFEKAVKRFQSLFGLSESGRGDNTLFQFIETLTVNNRPDMDAIFTEYKCKCKSRSAEDQEKMVEIWNAHVAGLCHHSDGGLAKKILSTGNGKKFLVTGGNHCNGFGSGLQKVALTKSNSWTFSEYSDITENPGMHKILGWALFMIVQVLKKNKEKEKISLDISNHNGYRCNLDYFNVCRYAKKGAAMTNHTGNAVDLHVRCKKTLTFSFTSKQISPRTLSSEDHCLALIDFLDEFGVIPGDRHKVVGQKPAAFKFGLSDNLRTEGFAKTGTWTHIDATVYSHKVFVQNSDEIFSPRYTAGQATVPVVAPTVVAPKTTEPTTAPAGTMPSRSEQLKAGAEAAKQVREQGSARFVVQPTDDDSDDSSEIDNPHLAMDSGLFPVGVNLTWHGGIHVEGDPGQPVQAMADGVVVAARFPEKDPAKPSLGSRNFVLVKHRTPKGDDFWSLYMHLLPIQLKSDDPAMIEAMPWLYDMELSTEGEGSTNFRPNPSTDSVFDPPRIVASGEKFTVLDQRQVGKLLWYQVESQSDNVQGWIAKTDRVETSHIVHGLEDLKAGKVVKFEHTVKIGTCLGFMSKPDPRKKPFVHWEVFSEQLASGGWGEVKDDDQNDVVCDAEALKKLINSGTREAVFLEPLTKDLVLVAYRDPKRRGLIIGNAYRFKSEWAVDWEDALQRYDKDVAKLQGPLFNLYRFWQDAEAAGCDLPKGGMVYHYQPSLFKREMFDKLVKEAARSAARTEETDPAEDGIETHWPKDSRDLDGQNKYNALIAEAAKKYNMDPLLLKSLIAQESAFNPKAHNNVGYAGLTQIGGAAIAEAGLSKGATTKVGGVYNYDMEHDERFDAKKSIFGGALIFSKKRKTIDKLVFSKYKTPLDPKEKEKFYVAAYNAGEGTVQKAFKKCKEDDPTWDDLIANHKKSCLWEAIPESWGPAKKYPEITEYVSEILQRRYQ